jgi:hypothetical protein
MLVPQQRLSSTQDCVAAPHLLIGYPLAYVICLHFRSLRLLRATQILSRSAGARGCGCALPHCGTDAPPAHPYLGGATYLAPH